jgi:hypothetical protein
VSTLESNPGFWRGVKQEAVAGLAVVAIGSAAAGILYLVYTVPTKLDNVLGNQAEIQKKLGGIEVTVHDHDVRIIKLEMTRPR